MKILKQLFFVSIQLCMFHHDVSGSYTSSVGSVTEQRTLSQVIGQSRLYKSIIFGSSSTATLTVSAVNALTLVGSNNLSVFAQNSPASSQVTITAQSGTTGIVALPQLALVQNGSNVTIDGNVIVNGNLTIDAGGDLVINGDLVVIGSVLIGVGSTVTVKGDVLFDGDGTNTVSIAGTTFDVEGIQTPLSNGSPIKQGNIVVRNTIGVTMSTALTTTGSVTFENNISGAGVVISGAVTAGKDVVFKDNVGSAADGVNIMSAIVAGGDIAIQGNKSSLAGANGIHVTSSGSITASNGTIKFVNNESSNTGAGTGKALYVEGTVTAFQDVILYGNKSKNTTAGANAVHVSGLGKSIKANGNIFAKDNTVASVGSVLATASSGKFIGSIVLEGDLTINSNIDIEGSLFAYGGNVIITSSAALDVSGDVTFDGQGIVSKKVDLASGSITAQNLLIKKYVATTTMVVSVASGFIATVKSDICIKDCTCSSGSFIGVVLNGTMTMNNLIINHCEHTNNMSALEFSTSSSTIATGDITVSNCVNNSPTMGCVFLNGSIMKALNGTIAFFNNESVQTAVVALGAVSVEANNIIFIENRSTMTGNAVYLASSSSIGFTASGDLRFERNKLEVLSTTLYGVDLNNKTYTCANIYFIHQTASNRGSSDTSHEIDDSASILYKYHDNGVPMTALPAANKYEKPDAIF